MRLFEYRELDECERRQMQSWHQWTRGDPPVDRADILQPTRRPTMNKQMSWIRGKLVEHMKATGYCIVAEGVERDRADSGTAHAARFLETQFETRVVREYGGSLNLYGDVPGYLELRFSDGTPVTVLIFRGEPKATTDELLRRVVADLGDNENVKALAARIAEEKRT
jgi:hypothetical protein